LGELRSRIESAEAGSQRLENRRLRNMASVEELGLRIKDAEEKLNSMIAQRAAIVEELQGLRKNLAQMEEKTKGAREGQSLEQKRIETIKEDIFALLQSTSQAGNRKESLNKRKKEIESQTGKLESEKTDLKRSIEEQRAKLDSRVLEMDRIKERRNHNQEKITNLESERTRITERITSLSDSLTKREMEVGVKKGRLASLHDLQNAFSGYGDGVKSLLGDEGEWSKGRIIAALEEIFDTSEKYQAALIAALDDWTDHLVVESMEFALEAVEKLERTGAGRAGFVPVNPEKFTRIQDRTNIPGVESMLDVITVKEGFEKVANLILGAAVIVKDLPRALELFQDTREPLRIITLDGARLSPGGIIAGGSRTSPAAKIISRKSEIRALEASIDHDEHELGQARDTLNDEDLKLSDINGQLESCRAESSEIKVEEVRIRKDLESTEGEMAKTEMRLDVLDMEIQRFMEESAAVLQEQMDLDNRVEQNTQKRNNLENMKAEAQERLAQYEAMMGEVSAQTNDERVKVAQYEEREKSLTREIDSLKGANERTSNQLNALEKEIREDAGEYERLQSDVKLGREREKSLMEEHRQACEAVKSLKEGIRVLAARIQSSETRSSEMGRAINQLREQAHELQTHIVRREQNENDIVEKITERYGIDPQGLAAKEPRPSVEEIATLKGRIESMGQVNLAAIDESRHTQERLNFLTEQESDLQGAVDSLYTTINKINRTTRDRFKEAFDRINEKFQEIFPFLFRGGAARLELSNADDLLETGVDILARPPGKRIQNMHLLSGGEKALTAVALIFSIFLIRPSPFCLLDEVDAPLDDANLSMFNEMLRRLSDSTQFILITHNKASMERADSLFGVTMAEAGVSNMVSVEFMDKEAV
jgi:chromosome segregation protein